RGLDDGLHDGCQCGDGAGAQVVTVGETTGDHDGVDAPEVLVGVPEDDRLGTCEADGAQRIDVVEGAGEGDDTALGTHLATSNPTTSKSSMTVLARRVSAIISTSSVETESSTSSSKRLPWRTSETPVTPIRPRARCTACPWGSRISAFGMTLTTTRATYFPLLKATMFYLDSVSPDPATT